jgi:hypothetical protein
VHHLGRLWPYSKPSGKDGNACQVSISPTFYEQLLCQNPFAKKLQTQIVSTSKLRKKLLYEKAALKILVKLTPERNTLAYY